MQTSQNSEKEPYSPIILQQSLFFNAILIKKRLFFLAIMFICSNISLHAQKSKEAETPVIDWSHHDFTKQFTVKNGGGKTIFKENKRIYISNFQIAQTVMANGKQAGVSNLAKMSVSMSAIDIKTYQNLVDKLYKQLQDRLIAEGYTLVSDEEVANSEFAKKEHNGKSIFCMYVKEPSNYKDQNGNQIINIFPTNKFIVANYSSILGNWPTKFGKAIDANIVSVILNITPMSFEGKKRTGYKGGTSIEGEASLLMYPNCTASNSRGGFGVWGSWVGGNSNWLGPKGIYETDKSTDIFGGVRGKYILDVDQNAYLKEVEALGGGLVQGYIQALINESK